MRCSVQSLHAFRLSLMPQVKGGTLYPKTDDRHKQRTCRKPDHPFAESGFLQIDHLLTLQGIAACAGDGSGIKKR
jgi:hypothetical protein